MPELLPLRHGRRVRSAFTFYRGAALTMASDLAATPATGIRVQACGDAHLCNVGGFATPERTSCRRSSTTRIIPRVRCSRPYGTS